MAQGRSLNSVPLRILPHACAISSISITAHADVVRVVLDNLSTHSPGALYEAFPSPEAHRILRRLEFHFTPKHASWLNMVEIEIGVLRGQCLDRHIDKKDRVVAEIAAWEKQRNEACARKSIGCSQPSVLAPSSHALTPTQPKSHNRCAEVLVIGAMFVSALASQQARSQNLDCNNGCGTYAEYALAQRLRLPALIQNMDRAGIAAWFSHHPQYSGRLKALAAECESSCAKCGDWTCP